MAALIRLLFLLFIIVCFITLLDYKIYGKSSLNPFKKTTYKLVIDGNFYKLYYKCFIFWICLMKTYDVNIIKEYIENEQRNGKVKDLMITYEK